MQVGCPTGLFTVPSHQQVTLTARRSTGEFLRGTGKKTLTLRSEKCAFVFNYGQIKVGVEWRGRAHSGATGPKYFTGKQLLFDVLHLTRQTKSFKVLI